MVAVSCLPSALYLGTALSHRRAGRVPAVPAALLRPDAGAEPVLQLAAVRRRSGRETRRRPRGGAVGAGARAAGRPGGARRYGTLQRGERPRPGRTGAPSP